MHRTTLVETILSNVTHDLMLCQDEKRSEALQETILYYTEILWRLKAGLITPMDDFLRALDAYEYPYFVKGSEVQVEAPHHIVRGLAFNAGLSMENVVVTHTH